MSKNIEKNYINNNDNEFKSIYEEDSINKDEYVIENYQSPKIIIISVIISIIYNLLFAILLIVYNEKTMPNNCNKLKWCNRFVYIVLFISTLITLFCGIIQIMHYKNSEKIQDILKKRTIYNFSVGTILLIILTTIYSITKDIKQCGSIRKIDLALIIFEWIILFMTCSCFWGITVYVLCCKGKISSWDGSGDVSEEDMKKYI